VPRLSSVTSIYLFKVKKGQTYKKAFYFMGLGSWDFDWTV